MHVERTAWCRHGAAAAPSFPFPAPTMPLLVPPPAASEGELLGLPVEALVASLKQETSNWLKLHESNEEMKSMISDTLAGQQTSEGIRLDKDDLGELQKACDENVSVM